MDTDTQISFLDAERGTIVVRGYDLHELAQRAHYADVAFLLIHGSLPGPGKRSMFANALGDGAVLQTGMQRLIEALPSGMPPLDALRTGISGLAGTEPLELLENAREGAIVTKGVRILSAAPTIVANVYRAANGLPPAEPEHDLSHPARFLRMIPGAATDDEAVAIFDRVLTCNAVDGPDHLTVAARAVAAGGGDVYGVVTAAAAVLRGGPHGGGPDGERTHAIDPRASLLDRDVRTLAARRDDVATHVTAYERAADVMLREQNVPPNVWPQTTLILHLLGIPGELLMPILLCARTAAVVAHVVEQHDERRTRPPSLAYEGTTGLHLPQDFVPAPL